MKLFCVIFNTLFFVKQPFMRFLVYKINKKARFNISKKLSKLGGNIC